LITSTTPVPAPPDVLEAERDGKEDGVHKELVGVEGAEEEEPSETDNDKGDPDYALESSSPSEDEEYGGQGFA
jgi:hypothetical protein